MSNLIWVGNTLIPRGVVIGVAIIIILLAVAGGLTWVTLALSRPKQS